MAVNTLKLLPPSKSGALAVRTSKISVGKKDKEKGGSLVKSEGGALANEILKMKSKIIRLQGEFDKNKKLKQKEEETKRKTEEKEKRSKREKQLEKKDGKGLNLPNVISRLPGGSIVDAIKRYLGFTFLGWLVGKYDVLMPQLEKFMSLAKPVFEGLVFATESIIKGVYGFVEAGYKAYDTVSATIKQIGGEDAEKTFHEFSSHLNKLLNGTLMAAMLIASTSPSPGGKTPPGKGAGYKAGFSAGFAAGLASRGKGPRYRSPGQAVAGGTLQENMQRQALTRQRMLESSGPRGPLDKIGRGIRGAGAQLQTGTLFKRGAGAQRALYNLPGKVKGIVPKGIGGAGAGRIPIIGPLLTFGIRTLVYGEKPQKAAAAAIGMGLGQAVGTFIGGLGATALGLGTAGIGAVVAPLIVGAGSVIGGLVGEWIGAALYDFIAGFAGKNDKPQGKSRGGTISSSNNRRNRRRVTTNPTRPRIQPQTTTPGKDIGGRKEIEKFYGDEKLESEGSVSNNIFKQDETRGEFTVKQLEKISKNVKKLPLDWIASIGGAFVDMTMGQKPDRKLASDVGRSFGIFVENVINNEIALTTGQITKSLTGLANGGIVSDSQQERGQISKKVASELENQLQNIFNQSYAIASENLKKGFFEERKEEKLSIPSGPTGRTGRTGSVGRGDAISPLDYENLDGGNISSMSSKVQVLYDEFRNIGYTDEASKRLIAEIGREGGFSNQNLFGTHTDPAAGITNQGMISWNQTRRDALLKAAKSAGVLDSNGNLKQTAESLRFQARFLSNEVPVYSKELHRALRNEGASGAKISQLLRDKYIIYRTTGGYSGGPDPEYGSGKTKEWYLKIAPGLKPKDFAPIRGQSGSVSYKGRKQSPLSVSYSPFMGMSGRPQIISGKGYRESTGTVHAGIDIESDLGTPLYAYTKGVVIRSGDFGDGYGNVVEFRDDKGNIHFFAHMKYDPKLEPGTQISKGQKVGEVGSSGRSEGPHLHWEIRNKRGALVDPTVFTKENPLQTLEENKETKKQQVSRGQFDIIIPLDHVPSNMANKIPDKKGGTTYKYASQTGADGRERQYTGLIASYVAERLKKQGYRVKIVKPEEFGNFEDYDNYITKQSRYGTTVLPFHLDADPNREGTGFLARIRQNDTEDMRVAKGIAPTLKKYASIFGSGQRYGGIDTQQNKTIDQASASPATLLELGSLVTLEKIFGKGFVTHPKYKQFLDELSTSISTVVSKKETKKPKETKNLKETYKAVMSASGSGGYTAENVRKAQSNYQAAQRQKQKNKPKRAWYDPRGWIGMQGGGATLSSSQPKSSYSTLNTSGSLKDDTSDQQVVVMYQREIIMS